MRDNYLGQDFIRNFCFAKKKVYFMKYLALIS